MTENFRPEADIRECFLISYANLLNKMNNMLTRTIRWMQLLSLLLLPTFVFAQSQGVGFNSVAAALAALRAKPGASVSVQGGWTIIQDSQTQSLWSFTPEGPPMATSNSPTYGRPNSPGQDALIIS
ncbi:MAG: hypothetical protein IOD05_04830 [Rhodobacter sp.]|nr:hypothetical protein [Rhodocyclaceae bacterium]MCA3502577.1 hypothetical protein [Rhodobacter sp.]MCA3020398.1 hypothetical protein [Rhodocyclaceae bacterium]MCA3024101.1 hypothetical protein [Rhodocyclaceae bacterium]MCA3037145.1 hypothetical protein [Rhodocyclaceae bacterium]